MIDNDYPLGAENDPNAPYNRVQDATEIMICGDMTVAFRTSIWTYDAIALYEKDDDGLYIKDIETCNVDFKKEFLDQHMTPLQLIQYLKKEMEEKMKKDPASKSECQSIIEECEVWEDEDLYSLEIDRID